MKPAGTDITMLQSEVLIAGEGIGPLLRLTENISFWGGVDPTSGKIIHRQHPQYGQSVAGKILAMDRSIGSSSGSSVLLELFRTAMAPVGIILTEPDLVISLAVVVAKEMAYAEIPLVLLEKSKLASLGKTTSISTSGKIGR